MPDTLQSNRPALPPEIGRRRTFAIISHPDAGKTTLTEKFLLYGGAIQMAGQVRAKGEARRTRSDFMQMEKDRGISVSASAMSFDFQRGADSAVTVCTPHPDDALLMEALWWRAIAEGRLERLRHDALRACYDGGGLFGRPERCDPVPGRGWPTYEPRD